MELQDSQGLVFWAEDDIASLTPEFENRWRAVMRDGSVAYRPTPPPAGRLRALGNALVNPAWLERTPRGWRDPAGFDFPGGELEALEPLPPEARVRGLPCERRQVLAFKTSHQFRSVVLTDVGELVWGASLPRALRAMPELIQVRQGLYVNRRRLRRSKLVCLTLDNGLTIEVSRNNKGLAGRLGLANLTQLEPCRMELYNRELRDWPFELARAPGEVLKAHFSDVRSLITQLVWQRLRYRQMGIEREWANSYRGFWYDPVAPALYRAGFFDLVGWAPPEGQARFTEDRASAEYLYLVMFQIFDYFVETARLFRFREFGFDEPRPETRQVGSTRPEVILVVEKESLHSYARRLAREFGVSVCLLASQPPLLASEYFAAAVGAAVSGPVHIIAYVDYDTGGWIMGHAFVKQMELFGLEVGRLDFLIRQDCFTAEEKRLYAHPCATSSPAHATKTRKWVRESGGIDGKALGIHSDHVRPYERVRELFVKLLG